MLNGNNDTISIDKHPAWANPLPGSEWVSFGATGDHSTPGYFDVATRTVVSFYHEFYLPGYATSGFLNIMADDSTSVFLNGNLLLEEAPILNNSYATCSDFATGCLESTTSSVNLMPYVVNGWNRLQFDVAQRAGSSFGLNYSGVIVDPITARCLNRQHSFYWGLDYWDWQRGVEGNSRVRQSKEALRFCRCAAFFFGQSLIRTAGLRSKAEAERNKTE